MINLLKLHNGMGNGSNRHAHIVQYFFHFIIRFIFSNMIIFPYQCHAAAIQYEKFESCRAAGILEQSMDGG
jgi:hypothetical protein